MGFENLGHLASEVFAILGEAGIPAEIIGGYALAHYGYVRNTMDIDVVVRDHAKALDILKARGYVEGRAPFSLKENASAQESVDVLPGGRKMSYGDVPNHMPTAVSTVPVFVSLEQLVASKVGVVTANGGEPFDKYRQRADVIKLIEVNDLPRDFLDARFDEVVVFEYTEIWKEFKVGRDRMKDAARNDPFFDFFNMH